jgi:hypothetical protein
MRTASSAAPPGRVGSTEKVSVWAIWGKGGVRVARVALAGRRPIRTRARPPWWKQGWLRLRPPAGVRQAAARPIGCRALPEHRRRE